jgi:hypothetical protein
MKQLGLYICWGMQDVPKLPEGFYAMKVPNEPVIAYSPAGGEFLIGKYCLYPWLYRASGAATCLHPKLGDRYIDTIHTIPLPKS